MIDDKILKDLYVEAVGLLIKVSHKLKQTETPDAQLHLQAVADFLHKNELYNAILGNPNGSSKNILSMFPEKVSNTTYAAAAKPQPKTKVFSYKSAAPLPPKPTQIVKQQPSDNSDDLW